MHTKYSDTQTSFINIALIAPTAPTFCIFIYAGLSESPWPHAIRQQIVFTFSSFIKLNPKVMETMHNNKLHQKHLVGVHMYMNTLKFKVSKKTCSMLKNEKC